MTQLTSDQISARVASLATALGDLGGVVHANVLAQAFTPEALERALNLAFARELGALIPQLQDVYAFLQSQSQRFGAVSLPLSKSTGRAFGTADFPAFAISCEDLTYMVVLEPLPPMVREAYPDMHQWAVHLRVCTRSQSNKVLSAPAPASLQFLGEFKYSAERPVPKGQTYFREWDSSDRGFLASTEPTTGPEAWTPADVTRGVGADVFRIVLTHLQELHAATKTVKTAKGNTLLKLSYRDAGNFGRYREEVLEGALTAEMVAALGAALNEGYQLIADQVGLPTPSFEEKAGESDWPSEELDHVWTVLDQFEDVGNPAPDQFHTDQAPTLAMTAEQFVQKVVAIGRNWDIAGEWARMQSAAAWNARTPDSAQVLRILPRAA